MHVLDGERLVRGRRSWRKTALMSPVHGHVRSGHVAVDEDPVDVVAQIAEARAQPLARRGGAARAVAPLRVGLVVDEVGMHEILGELSLATGEQPSHHQLDDAAQRGGVSHSASLHPRSAVLGAQPTPHNTGSATRGATASWGSFFDEGISFSTTI